MSCLLTMTRTRTKTVAERVVKRSKRKMTHEKRVKSKKASAKIIDNERDLKASKALSSIFCNQRCTQRKKLGDGYGILYFILLTTYIL